MSARDGRRHFPTEPPGFCAGWPGEDSAAYRESLGSPAAPEFTAVGRAGRVGQTGIMLWALLWVLVAVAGASGWVS